MVLSLIMNAINVVGNSILIYGFHLGARGAAIATLASRWTAASGCRKGVVNPAR